MDKTEITARLEKVDKTFEESAAKLTALTQITQANYGGAEVCMPAPVTQGDLMYLSERLGYLRDEIGYLRESFYKHANEGHLPKIIGAAALTKALKALGLGDDYEVARTTIYANDGIATSEQFLITSQL